MTVPSSREDSLLLQAAITSPLGVIRSRGRSYPASASSASGTGAENDPVVLPNDTSSERCCDGQRM